MSAPPYFFADLDGNPALLDSASYLKPGRTYRFPAGHRLAGDQTISTMEPMRRDLFRLFARLNHDVMAFTSFLSHGIQDLLLPFSSVHVKMTGAWLYPGGAFHSGIDFNDEPQSQYSYPGHATRTNFQVHAAAGGTVVGWDESKLLTLEHVSSGGRLCRTIYNMIRNVPVGPVSPVGIVNLGGAVAAGQVIGEVWDPPGNPIHLHFGMAIPHTISTGWVPDLNPLLDAISDQFPIRFSEAQQRDILKSLGSSPWQPTEWFFVDPFGRYDIFNSSNASYGPLGRGFYYPVPTGPGTYAFRDAAIGGDPGVDRIPLFAGSQSLLNNVSVRPLSMATLAAVCE